MKKVTSFAIALVLLFALVGCTNSTPSSIERVYSFSGESNEIRVINGVAVIGGEKETFYGGTLELKNDNFKDITGYSIKFYISDGTENWTLLNNVVKDETGTFELKNQETGRITGQVLNTNMDENAFEEHLYFELVTTDENGVTETYTVPMKVTAIE